MSNLFKQLLGYSHAMQRRDVAVLVVALLFWLMTSATHIHVDDDFDAQGKRTVVCSVCLSLPAGAAPPAAGVVKAMAQVAGVAIAAPVVPAPRLTITASYRSRAPPAV